MCEKYIKRYEIITIRIC